MPVRINSDHFFRLRRSLLRNAIALGAVGATGQWSSFAAAQPNAKPFRIALVGDCLFTAGLRRDDADLRALLPLLRDTNVTIGNFEGTLANARSWASSIDPGGVPICGGLNVRGSASVAGDLGWLGVDMVGTANNHAMDWGTRGLIATNRKLSRAGVQHAGSGVDLAQARKAAYYAGEGGRTALISCASTYWPGAFATHSNASFPGRPGVSPIRVLIQGSGAARSDSVDPRDLEEVLQSVRDARRRADRIVVSCHTHESESESKGESASDRPVPPTFLRQLAHSCIDSGADIFFSHGPHVLRGIELYQRKPIFYSLGAFIFRARETRPLPQELYDNCQMGDRDPLKFFDRTTRGWNEDQEFWQSIIVQVEFDAKAVTAVRLIPTIIRHGAVETWGMPRLADGPDSTEILARLQRFSMSYGTVIHVQGTVGFVDFPAS